MGLKCAYYSVIIHVWLTSHLLANSNWTFIVLNLPYSKLTLRHNKTKNRQPISISGDRKESKHHRECQGVSKTNVCLGVKVGFEAFSEGGQRGGRRNLLRKSIPKSGSIKSKTITKMFDAFMV